MNLDFHPDPVDVNGYVSVNVADINAVSTSPVTTIAPVIGTASLLATDASGRVVVEPTGLDAIPGEAGFSMPQEVAMIFDFLLGQRSGVPTGTGGGTVTIKTPAGVSRGTLTYDGSGNVTGTALTPPSD